MPIADTEPTAEQVQLDLLRSATVARRASLARSLSCTVIQLTRRAVVAACPTTDGDELAARLVAVCYGPELANRLRRDLETRQRQREP
ncbi:MAG: hypothetical protein HY534_04740 [Chloroflexi bacterium]|nr:hypothetical protein [Chloroflexota bacterium]